ncbi:uncharacterized protein V6R79_006170 [Siganus canaliculatus]
MKDMDLYQNPSVPPQSDLSLDLITEFITEDRERSAVPLPGPPRPPDDLLCLPHSENHRRLRPSPLLVARGTSCQPTHTFPQPSPQRRTPRDMAHPSRGAADSSHRGRDSSCLLASKNPGSLSSQKPAGDPEMLEQKPRLVVVEEPKERGMRFRYECEGRSAGSILGASSTETNKTQPTVEIQGSIDHIKKVTVTASLVTKDLPHRPHPHCLVGKDCPNGSGICVVTIIPHSNRRHSFANLGIQCVRRKELDASLQKRRNQNIDPFQTGNTKGIEDMDMNAVRLCFQCEIELDDGRRDRLGPVVSNPIYDKKATTTSQLKISCLNVYKGSCAGKTEIFMLCDKVQKDDIEIIFRRGSWKANGEFAQTDVHRQIAIVFKTPPYQDRDITEEVEVCITLRRLSDQMESEPITFTYLPDNTDPYGVNRKRKIKSDIDFREKPCVTERAPAPEPVQFPPPQTVPSDERLCATMPHPSATDDTCYDMDSVDMTTIFNQLSEIPALRELTTDVNLSWLMTAAPDIPNTDINMDGNFNQNYESYPQDFTLSQDMQFTMLFNESQMEQLGAQDGSSSMLQVKTEEEL